MILMKTENQIEDPDLFYDQLSMLHADLDEARSSDLNARLVLILANQIGDMKVLTDCLNLAMTTGGLSNVVEKMGDL
jgi:hypothetical protein